MFFCINFLCFLGLYLHFTFFAVKKKKKLLEKTRKLEYWYQSVRGFRMGISGPLEGAQLANQIQGFRILDRSKA